MDFSNDFDQENDLTINILPMIDVLLAILIFFVLSSVIINRNRMVEINRPKSTANRTIDTNTVIVSINQKGEIFINTEPSDQTSFIDNLKTVKQNNVATTLLIDADQTIQYGYIFNIIEKAKSADFESIGLVTNRQLKAIN